MKNIAFETVNGIVYKAVWVGEDKEKLIVNEVDVDRGSNLRIPNLKNTNYALKTDIEFYKDKIIWISRQ